MVLLAAENVRQIARLELTIDLGNLGGIISSFVYLSKDSPQFVRGHAILIGFLSMSTILATFMTVWLRRENARRDREYKDPSEYTPMEMELERERGDNATFFRYTV